MSLAGLILTDDDVLGGDAPARTLLPVAGQTLIEYQVRIARACGAAHIVVLVDRIPGALVSAFDRLRADGMDVDVARDARGDVEVRARGGRISGGAASGSPRPHP